MVNFVSKLLLMRIFLVGFMGSGKTTVAKNLATMLQFSYFDLDEQIETSTGMTINQIFQNRGEPFFRQMEQAQLFQTISKERTIIATGGGTPCSQPNMDFILAHGLSVYLRVDPEVLTERLVSSKFNRPYIKNLDEKGIRRLIRVLLPEREPWYQMANYVIEANLTEHREVEERIISQVKELTLFRGRPGLAL